jgi:predicted ATP-grasp superfamily ATP-dependent carboligase
LIESCAEPAVVRQSVRLLQGLAFNGIVGVEWKRDPESGRQLLLEVNARATNTSALPPACGVDLPWIAFCDAIGRRLAPVTRWKTGVKWLWLSKDIWAARALGMSALAWLRSLRGQKAYAVYAADYLRPFLLEYRLFAGARISRALRRLARLLPRPRQDKPIEIAEARGDRL